MPSLKLRVEGNEAMVAKDYKLAATRFADAAKIVPNDPDTHYNLALALGQDKQYQEALAAIDKAIALKPEDKAYLDLKQRLVANQSMSKARDILIEGDTLYNEKKDYPAALKKYEEALPMLTDPVAQALVYDQIGKAYTTMRQSEPAVSAFNKAIELDPEKKQYKDDLVGHYRVMAQYYFTEKQYDKAFDFFKQAGQSPYQIGQSSAAKGDNDLALMAFERSLKDDPQNAEAYFELGTLYYYNKKDSARAKEMFVKYMEVGKDEKRISQAKDLLTVIDRKK
jgi:tetratricopeptide (TPR) repeat protein